MFGVVPKVVWAKNEDTDEQNRVLLAMRTLIAVDRDAGRIILTETGAGTKWDDDEIERFAFEDHSRNLLSALKHFGAAPQDVTDVVITHLHFDHNGGLTEWADPAGGEARPRFPSARHWVHARHLSHALSPTQRDRASFIQRDFQAVLDAGLFERVDGDQPECHLPNMKWFVTSGHTPGQLSPWFFDEHRQLLFTGDTMPTSSHLPVPWVMAYDLEPLKTVAEKEAILAACRDEGLLLAFPHDHRFAGGQVDLSGKRPKIGRPWSGQQGEPFP